MSVGDFINTLIKKKEPEYRQRNLSNKEWEEISNFIKKESKFIAIGFSLGCSKFKVKTFLNGEVYGTNLNPSSYGFKTGSAKNIPYKLDLSSVVYCPQVLEHVNYERQAQFFSYAKK